MNIFRLYKKTGLFLWINIIGLSIGLAVSILLILFVVNELSYDKHIANNERIVWLTTQIETADRSEKYPINLRKAYTELPEKVPAVEAAVQLYNWGASEFTNGQERYPNIQTKLADADYFDVFQMKFLEGTPQTALTDLRSLVLTKEKAEAIFGDIHEAMGKELRTDRDTFVVSGVVEAYPYNTSLNFEALGNIKRMNWIDGAGLEFYTYYLVNESVSVSEARKAIVAEYEKILEPFGAQFGAEINAKTFLLTDIYLKSDVQNFWGKQSNMKFVWLLTVLAVFILILAVTNFINLFMAQGETRMKEIGVRKTLGAQIPNIVKQFFSEITVVVSLAFVIGFLLMLYLMPYFSELVNREIDSSQLLTPLFMFGGILLFLLTIVLAAFYPSFYLSRFNPLAILNKQIRFSKQRLNVVVVVFQSFLSIILISFILIFYQQIMFLQNLPLGYSPENVVMVYGNRAVSGSYAAVKQELLANPDIIMVSGGSHQVGGGTSGQGIKLLESDPSSLAVNEYRMLPGLCELMNFQLAEGEFYKETTHDSIPQIVLNEEAIKALGLESPVVGQDIYYRRKMKIIGVVKDFYYGNPVNKIEPIMLTRVGYPSLLYLKVREGINRMDAEQTIANVLKEFDPNFTLNAVWSADLYADKFKEMKINERIILIASVLSVFIAMLGLMAMHLYSTIRRTKEIGLRRINGASRSSIFKLLSINVIKWVFIAGVLAAPVTYLIAHDLFKQYDNAITLNWVIFVVPVLIQAITALLTTSGVTLRALSVNPVTILKQD
ncbi:ABC transporter permease [Massilibacteroides sp.]|uniref:ABC transporter permease n=1 Tax=Massilibacteroides sp. TaxID=2034766 RepID=UPI0026179270|nr:ABC transporter permease [Massilibacteroides sp.]MDD4514291.1 ABC transporter permease [Massilibacteroides sp.]